MAFGIPCVPRHQRGLSLIELVAAVAVFAIVTAVCLPTLHGAVSGTRATTVGNRLLADLALARTEAIMRHDPGVVCPSVDGRTCSGGTDWSSGWIVFVDTDGDNQRSDREPVLSTASSSDTGGLRVDTSVGRTKIRYLPDGRNGGTNLSVRVCEGPRLMRQVIVNISGRPRIERDDAPNAACSAG